MNLCQNNQNIYTPGLALVGFKLLATIFTPCIAYIFRPVIILACLDTLFHPVYVYFFAGPEAEKVLRCWESLPKLYPPQNWQPPPPAGYIGASGMRRHSIDPWRPVSGHISSLVFESY